MGNRRRNRRGAFERKIPAYGDRALRVLMGRDLSARGMRVEGAQVEVGDRLHLAIWGEVGESPLLVWATARRDDREDGIALIFDDLDLEAGQELEKLVARLPAVEPLSGGEAAAMGTVVSEVLES